MMKNNHLCSIEREDQWVWTQEMADCFTYRSPERGEVQPTVCRRGLSTHRGFLLLFHFNYRYQFFQIAPVYSRCLATIIWLIFSFFFCFRFVLFEPEMVQQLMHKVQVLFQTRWTILCHIRSYSRMVHLVREYFSQKLILFY